MSNKLDLLRDALQPDPQLWPRGTELLQATKLHRYKYRGIERILHEELKEKGLSDFAIRLLVVAVLLFADAESERKKGRRRARTLKAKQNPIMEVLSEPRAMRIRAQLDSFDSYLSKSSETFKKRELTFHSIPPH